jgi:hypothetical protein
VTDLEKQDCEEPAKHAGVTGNSGSRLIEVVLAASQRDLYLRLLPSGASLNLISVVELGESHYQLREIDQIVNAKIRLRLGGWHARSN